MNTREIVREYAGTLTTKEIAEMAGVVSGRVRVVAHEEGVSLQTPNPVEPKRVWYASCPAGEEESFAEDVRFIMGALELLSGSAVLIAGVRVLAALLRGTDGG